MPSVPSLVLQPHEFSPNKYLSCQRIFLTTDKNTMQEQRGGGHDYHHGLFQCSLARLHAKQAACLEQQKQGAFLGISAFMSVPTKILQVPLFFGLLPLRPGPADRLPGSEEPSFTPSRPRAPGLRGLRLSQRARGPPTLPLCCLAAGTKAAGGIQKPKDADDGLSCSGSCERSSGALRSPLQRPLGTGAEPCHKLPHCQLKK